MVVSFVVRTDSTKFSFVVRTDNENYNSKCTCTLLSLLKYVARFCLLCMKSSGLLCFFPTMNRDSSKHHTLLAKISLLP